MLLGKSWIILCYRRDHIFPPEFLFILQDLKQFVFSVFRYLSRHKRHEAVRRLTPGKASVKFQIIIASVLLTPHHCVDPIGHFPHFLLVAGCLRFLPKRSRHLAQGFTVHRIQAASFQRINICGMTADYITGFILQVFFLQSFQSFYAYKIFAAGPLGAVVIGFKVCILCLCHIRLL